MHTSCLNLEATMAGDWSPRSLVDSRPPEARYVTTQNLGEGGTARVTAVLDPVLRRESALKRLHRRFVSDPICVRRFLQEARVTAHISHRGITQVHDLGLDAADCPWFTMELVRGETLSDWVARQGLRRLESERLGCAVCWLAQIADTVQYAHELGVIHRDLKPANVMRDFADRAYVLDWGAAHLLPPAADLVWEPDPPGCVVGTPCFLSPEQARGEHHRIDGRTDVFGLGALLFYVLTGASPHAPGPPFLVAQRAARERVPDPRTLVPVGLPRELCRIARSALAPERDARPWSAACFARMLRAWLAQTPLAQTPGGLTGAALVPTI